MNESMEQSGSGSEGVGAPSDAGGLPLFGPVSMPESSAAASDASRGVAGHYDAPGYSDVADALSTTDDGRPGGPTPSSSGFSWRVGGRPSPVMQSQGGIPNEFDHLFRDSDADGRRSLMPSQGAFGVVMPPAVGRSVRPALPPAQSRGELTGGGDSQLPGYQSDGDDADDAGYPRQPYSAQAYQQAAAYLASTHAPDGAAATGGTGSANAGDGTAVPGQTGDADERHTQAIPRVTAQLYGASAPQQPGGPGSDGGLAAPVGAGRNATPVLLISVGVFIVLVVLAAVAFSSGGGKAKKDKPPAAVDTPAATASGVDPAAKAQADAVYALIAQSKVLVRQASNAIGDVAICKNVAAAQQTFTTVGQKRQAQVDGVKALPVDKIPNGVQLSAGLAKAWQYAADSERELAGWAADNASCTGKPGSNDKRALADADAGKAGAAKIAVVSDWNAVAAKVGQQAITKEDL
jgi:hypothetical protein